jgi:hypothetical protein
VSRNPDGTLEGLPNQWLDQLNKKVSYLTGIKNNNNNNFPIENLTVKLR